MLIKMLAWKYLLEEKLNYFTSHNKKTRAIIFRSLNFVYLKYYKIFVILYIILIIVQNKIQNY